MQTVSIDYINELNKQIVGSMLVEADILNVDVDAQSQLSISELINLDLSYDLDPIFKLGTLHTPDIATFEKDFMKANGACIITSPYRHFISSTLSSTTPNANGEYSLNGETRIRINASLYNWGKPLTLYLGNNTSRVKIDFIGNGTYSKTVNADNGWIVIDDVPETTYYNSINITILTLTKPQQRARIRKIISGTVISLSGNDILSMDYSDYNDGTMIELPQCNLTLAVNNLDGTYNQEKEYDNPSFTKHHTQFLPRVGQVMSGAGVEWISMGRYFLDNYTVTTTEIKFNAISPIGLLNEYAHANWCDLATKQLSSRFLEIISPEGNDAPVSAVKRFGVNIPVTSSMKNMSTMSKNPCPPMSTAQALQLLCNWSGNVALIQRGSMYTDIQITARRNDVVRAISGDTILGKIEWSAEVVPNKIEVTAHTITNNTTATTLSVDPENTYNYANIFSASPIQSITGGAETLKAYMAVVQTYGGENTEFPAYVRGTEAYNKTIIMSNGNGETVTLNNPLLSGVDGISLSTYAGNIYEEIKYNITAQFAHRGFPELDCGDVITIETQPGVLVKARVIENKLTINQGSVSGSTKVRRLS